MHVTMVALRLFKVLKNLQSAGTHQCFPGFSVSVKGLSKSLSDLAPGEAVWLDMAQECAEWSPQSETMVSGPKAHSLLLCSC